MKLNKEIFHKFFYSKKRGLDTISGIRGKANVSYRGNIFRSYNTEIGRIISNGDAKVLLVSRDHMTLTTGGHISALTAACPFGVIEVPYQREDNEIAFGTDADVISVMLRRLITYMNDNQNRLSRAEDRAIMRHTLASYLQLKRFTSTEIGPVTRALITTIEAAITAADEKLKIRRKKAAERAAMLAKEKAIRAEKIINEYCPNWSLLRKVKACFTNYFADCSAEVHNALYDWLLNAYPLHSFVWYDEEKQVIRTSQCVTLSPNTAARAYKAFKAGKIQAGMHLGPYEIREITPEYIQIGCHKIPMENIEQLAALMGWNA